MSATTNEKWLLVSCLQKSIRKGFEDIACTYAEQLYELDKGYLISKIGTILLEDIFLANTVLIDDFFKYANNKNHKKIEIIQYIRKLTQSVKDRTAFDIIKITKLKNIEHIDNPEQILKNRETSIIEKFQSAKQILNQIILKNPLNKDNYHIEKLLNEYEITSNANMKNIIKNVYSLSKDSNFILLGLIDNNYTEEKNQKIGNVKTGDVITCHFQKELLNNKWLIDGIDWHTKEGKLAIQEFSMENTHLKSYIKEIGALENIDILIGLLLFKMIGQEVHKRLFYPTAVVASKLSTKLEIEKVVTHKNFNQHELFNLFKQDYTLLKALIQDKFTMPDPNSFPF